MQVKSSAKPAAEDRQMNQPTATQPGVATPHSRPTSAAVTTIREFPAFKLGDEELLGG